MKLKKVAALCSAQKAFHLFDDVREGGEIRQWLGDGYALYLLSGLPILNENNVCAMFDVPEKKRKKCRCKQGPMPEGLNSEDWEQGERSVNDDWPTVEYDGRVVKPLSTRDGITFILSQYLTPLEDMADYLRLYERVDANGDKYIVAKNGMEIAAIITPFDIISAVFVEQLEDLAERCRMTLTAKKERSALARMGAVDKRQETLFQKGESGGEGTQE